MEGIRWLFFDVGSTLVDESRAYERRIREAIAGTDISYERFYDAMLGFYRQNKKGDLEALAFFDLPKPPWHHEEEAPYPQAAYCLSCLRQDYRIGVVANQAAGTTQRLARMQLLQYIDLVVASAEEGVAKPDARIFRIALARAGCPSQHAVMIGDRLDNDIKPAKQLGMKTVWVKQGFGGFATPQCEAESPDHTVQGLEELPGLFSRVPPRP